MLIKTFYKRTNAFAIRSVGPTANRAYFYLEKDTSFYHYTNRRIVLTKQRLKKRNCTNVDQADRRSGVKVAKISKSVVSPCNAANCSYNEIPVREERVNEQGRDVHGQLP